MVSEDGMSNVFSPGELIGLLRAERMGRSLEEAISYRAVFLGITRASLNTQSFISEASFSKSRSTRMVERTQKCCSGALLVPDSREDNKIPLEKKEEYIRGGNERDFVPPQKIIWFSHPSLI